MVRRLAVLIALHSCCPRRRRRRRSTQRGGRADVHRRARQDQQRHLRRDRRPGGSRSPRAADDTDPINVTGCTGLRRRPYTCDDVTIAVLDAGDLSDRITAGYLDDTNAFVGLKTIPIRTLSGGDGNDALAGGAQPTSSTAARATTTSTASAATTRCAAATATTRCGPTSARTRWSAATASTSPSTAGASRPRSRSTGSPTTATLGENDLIGADVEDIEAAADDPAQTVTITGDGRANRLSGDGRQGRDHRRRGLGLPRGRPAGRHADLARRLARHVVCNAGTDTVIADTLDTISPTCENVQIAGHARRPVRRPPAERRLDRARRRRVAHRERRDDADRQRHRRPRRRARPVPRRRPHRVRGHRGAVHVHATSRAAATSAATR